MKKFVAVLLIALLTVALLTGCQAIGRKVAEGVIKNVTGTDVNVSDKGNGTTLTGKDGTSISVGEDVKWPAGKMGDLPELKGKIVGVFGSGEKGNVVSMEAITKADAEAYVQTIKDLGYEITADMTLSEGTYMLTAKKDGYIVSYTYILKDDACTCVLSYTKE
jgi:hypothetical protein